MARKYGYTVVYIFILTFTANLAVKIRGYEMNRRTFLQSSAAAAAALGLAANLEGETPAQGIAAPRLVPADKVQTAGHTLICQFQHPGAEWRVYEDLRTRDGAITFVSSSGDGLVLTKSAEPSFMEGTPYLGLTLREIGLTAEDLLAKKLLANGDPDPAQVRGAAPPIMSRNLRRMGWRLPWDTFAGTKQSEDTMPAFPVGSTRTYHPNQYFPELTYKAAKKRYDGLLGGWMPVVRRVVPMDDGSHIELLIFGDVAANDKFIVQTWHRTARIQNGRITKAVYGYSYPAYPPAREDPEPEAFYRGLLQFAAEWQRLMAETAPAALPTPSAPEGSLADMARYAFVKELMTRPCGVYPKYGAVDRDYYGSEYEGFQDIFTSSLYANLEWGRFEMAKTVFDNYFTDYVDAKGAVNMRGPETAQYGMMLDLIARYYSYTGDAALLRKHRAKIEATAAILTTMHDESLKLPASDVGHGLIHGWSESDSCLFPNPQMWWLPYFSNSAFAARGLGELASVWRELGHGAIAAQWMQHSDALRKAVIASVRNSVRHDITPPYVGTYPGTTLTFWESLRTQHPSPQGWPHRAYAELLQAGILPDDLANIVINCMRAYGATTFGIVANVEPPHPEGRDILGFISYGYALQLLRLDRIEEYLLFLYAHRYHDHSRGSWTAAEVAGITGGSTLYCIPAQMTIPLLVRWMLVFEDGDRLSLGKAVPREWTLSGSEMSIRRAPTRWGRVSFRMQSHGANRIDASAELHDAKSPRIIEVKFRLPKGKTLRRVAVNGKPAHVSGESVLIHPGAERSFAIRAEVV